MNHCVEMYSVCYFEFDGTQQTAPHHHENNYQAYYVRQGRSRFLYQSEWITVDAGQVLIVVPGNTHGMISQGPSKVLDIKFNVFDSVLAADMNRYLSGVHDVPKEANDLFLAMIALKETRSSYMQRLSSLYAESICYLMLRELAPPPALPEESVISQLDAYKLSPCVKRVLPFLEGASVYPVEPFSIQAIANQIGYNARYVSSKFSEELGISVSSYFRQLQADKAKELLYNTDLKISEISDLLNYKNMSHFNKQFHKHTGMSPGEYRKLCRRKEQQ